MTRAPQIPVVIEWFPELTERYCFLHSLSLDSSNELLCIISIFTNEAADVTEIKYLGQGKWLIMQKLRFKYRFS